MRYRTYFNFLAAYSLGNFSVSDALIRNKERGTIVPRDAERRILAKEATQENNPNKLIEIIEALNRAVNEQEQHQKKAVGTSHSDSQHSTDNVQSIDSSRHFRKSKN